MRLKSNNYEENKSPVRQVNQMDFRDKRNSNSSEVEDELKPSTISLPQVSKNLLTSISDIPYLQSLTNGFQTKTRHLTREPIKNKNQLFNTRNQVNSKSLNYEKRLGRSLTELKNQKQGERITRANVNFLSYLKNECSSKKNATHSNFYEALIEYFENQLDVRTIIKTKYDLEIFKFLFFSERDDNDELFNLRVPIEEVLYYHDSLSEKLNIIENFQDEINKQESTNKTLRQMRNNLGGKRLFD